MHPHQHPRVLPSPSWVSPAAVCKTVSADLGAAPLILALPPCTHGLTWLPMSHAGGSAVAAHAVAALTMVPTFCGAKPSTLPGTGAAAWQPRAPHPACSRSLEPSGVINYHVCTSCSAKPAPWVAARGQGTCGAVISPRNFPKGGFRTSPAITALLGIKTSSWSCAITVMSLEGMEALRKFTS